MMTLSVEELAEVDEALAYLEEFGRSAALPDVRHRMQTSAHFPNMSEVRINFDEKRIFRILVCFDHDDVPVLLVAGNKFTLGNTWYLSAIPAADELFLQYLTALEGPKEE
jgi:hypothetical protein